LDGRQFVYVANNRLYLKAMGERDSIRINSARGLLREFGI